MDALAITDHGAMYGVIQFYQEAKAAGIKPIIGCETYVAANSRLGRNAVDKQNYHLVLLAKDLTGYHNLIQLITKAHLEGFYYKPRVDKEILEQHKEGLIAMSACLAGEVPTLIWRTGRRKPEKPLWTSRPSAFLFEIQAILRTGEGNQALIQMWRTWTSYGCYQRRALVDKATKPHTCCCASAPTLVYDEKR